MIDADERLARIRALKAQGFSIHIVRLSKIAFEYTIRDNSTNDAVSGVSRSWNEAYDECKNTVQILSEGRKPKLNPFEMLKAVLGANFESYRVDWEAVRCIIKYVQAENVELNQRLSVLEIAVRDLSSIVEQLRDVQITDSK